MKAIMAQYYNNLKFAEQRVKQLQIMWQGRFAWYIVCAPNGYFVISEIVARKAYPHINFSYKDRKYITL